MADKPAIRCQAATSCNCVEVFAMFRPYTEALYAMFPFLNNRRLDTYVHMCSIFEFMYLLLL